MNPYNVLGLKKDCADEDITKQYRILSKKYHPDMPNGDAERFREISEAVEILRDKEQRAFFDEHGFVLKMKPADAEEKMKSIITQLLEAWLEEVCKPHCNVEIQEFITHTINNKEILLNQGKVNLKSQLSIFEKQVSKIVSDNEDNMLVNALNNKITLIKGEIDKVDTEIHFGRILSNKCKKFKTKFFEEAKRPMFYTGVHIYNTSTTTNY